MTTPFLDLLPEPPRLNFLAPASFGSKRERTPAGYLLIRDVAIARTGPQDYRADEIPIEPGPMGYIVIERQPEDVFDPATLASFEGVPITDDHPTMMVGPENYRDHLVGVINNVRRGDGSQSHLMLADALIYCANAIDKIEQGKRQVSCGYEADYVRLEAGRGKQINITGNHLAIVDRGRCGPVCAFGDSHSEPPMKNTATATAIPGRVPSVRARGLDRKARAFDRAFRAFRDDDVDAFVEEMTEAVTQAVEQAVEETVAENVVEAPAAQTDEDAPDANATVEALTARLQALEAKVEELCAQRKDEPAAEEAKTEDADPAEGETGEEDPTVVAAPEPEMVNDAAFRDTAARAEILSPGLRMPTTDGLRDAAARGGAILAHKRRALTNYFAAHADMASSLLGTKTVPDFAKMAPASVHLAFVGASNAVRTANNSRVTNRILVGDSKPEGRMTAAERNRLNREFWASKGA
ncbi:DUF2213 domain-containing protein [Methylobacterium sp. 1030]|uniref:DUF2213 domain-containing protein n=1 Tax=Methylobacterium sp. 1030 TaxID=3156404 RepID=UPI003397CE53